MPSLKVTFDGREEGLGVGSSSSGKPRPTVTWSVIISVSSAILAKTLPPSTLPFIVATISIGLLALAKDLTLLTPSVPSVAISTTPNKAFKLAKGSSPK